MSSMIGFLNLMKSRKKSNQREGIHSKAIKVVLSRQSWIAYSFLKRKSQKLVKYPILIYC